MKNFNTNQVRQLYVVESIAEDNKVENIVDNLQAAFSYGVADGIVSVVYKNGDGILTRSDSFKIGDIKSLNKTEFAKMAIPLKAHTVKFGGEVSLAELKGKAIKCSITIEGVFDYDASNSRTFTVSVDGNEANTASATAFHKALAEAIVMGIPNVEKNYPFIKVYSNGAEVTAKAVKAGTVTGSADGVVLVEGLQKYVRGKLSGEPCAFSVAFSVGGNNVESIVWGSDTISDAADASLPEGAAEVYPAIQVIADLEYFALGERGDVYRGSAWPNEYPTTYNIDLTKEYDIVTIEYAWQGSAENIQKSPKMIQIAAPSAVATQFYEALDAAINPSAPAGSGE